MLNIMFHHQSTFQCLENSNAFNYIDIILKTIEMKITFYNVLHAITY